MEFFVFKEITEGIKVFTGIQIAESKLSYNSKGAGFHASEEVNQVAVEVVVHLKGRRLRVSKQDASGTSENINDSLELPWKQRIENMKDG